MILNPKKWKKISSNIDSEDEYTNLIDDYKQSESKNMKFNPKFGMMSIIARKKERELRFPKEFDNRFHPRMKRPKHYNLLNKPWSPKPGKAPIIEDLQTLV